MGTDTGPPPRFQGYFEHEELTRMVEAGLTPTQALVAANAKVTGFCVVPSLPYVGCEAEIGADFKGQAEAAIHAEVNKNLLAIETGAKEAGVECETAKAKSAQPYEAIIEAAATKECDLIIMASHGRRGVGALLLGSETQKVLTHSKIPVLVYR